MMIFNKNNRSDAVSGMGPLGGFENLGHFDEFMEDESGMGVVEIILIMVVLIAMCIIFKQQITSLVNNIWNSINKNAKKIY